ncbi:MAG: 16S rRNA processing protein RimM, partial [Hyphomonadaceae bacterium]|nr:16S rRNA processing protein RimM [Hyphomonadaceae bacterium]
FTEDPKACLTYGPLKDKNGKTLLTVKSSRMVKNAIAAHCEEIETREQAEALKSTKLYVYRSDMPEPDEDEFYHEDLVGLRAETEDGKVWGLIKAVQNFGAGDVLEIAGGKDEQGEKIKAFFHSFSRIGVPVVDIRGGRVVIFFEEADEDPNHTR